jgi:23S rRNA pseudouridine1911/1915/1917 synthase
VIVEGRAEKTGRLEHVLDKDHENNKVTVHPAGSGKGKLAVLHYRLISHKNGLSLIEVELETGRPHQIRVQLTASGLPVWGDYKYGKKQPDGRRIALMSYILEFDHPTRDERLRFEADKPAGEPWNQFSA